VTASCSLERDADCLTSWQARARYTWPTYIVLNAPDAKDQVDRWQSTFSQVLWVPEYKGVVPAFALGIEAGLRAGMQIIAALHSDVLVEEDDWDAKVWEWFNRNPRCGLAGFGGGTGLGSLDLYTTPYDPMQLARVDFVSNLRDAEAHGRRSRRPERVACLDGLSQIGRATFWKGQPARYPGNLFTQMQTMGITHHGWDSMLGVFAAKAGWETWMLPIAAHHFGGRTAVGDQGYHEWAEQQAAGGDQAFWQQAHRIFYLYGKGILPIRVRG
jgi:hypothetical protein